MNRTMVARVVPWLTVAWCLLWLLPVRRLATRDEGSFRGQGRN